MILNKLTKKLTKQIALLSLLVTAQVSLPGINLRLSQKPHHMSSYDWCTKQARKLVLGKINKALRILGINEHQWESIKNRTRKAYLNSASPNARQIKPLPEHVKRTIKNITSNPCLKKTLGITHTKENHNNYIIAVRPNKKNIIFQMDESPGPLDYEAISNGSIIKIAQDAINNMEKLEVVLCHELGHIFREHSLEHVCLRITYDQYNQAGKIRTAQGNKFEQALEELEEAMEIEADIVAGFKNPRWIENLAYYFGEEYLTQMARGR